MWGLNSLYLQQAWQKTSGQVNYLAPLPEDPVDTRLTGLLVPAPHVVPEKKAKKKAAGTRRSSRRLVVSDSLLDDPEVDSSREDEEEEKEASPPAGGEKKRKAAPAGEVGGSKKGRTLPTDYSINADDGEEECASGSSGNESDTTRRRELFRDPVAFFLAFFSGTT